MIQLPGSPQVSAARRVSLARLSDLTRKGPPRDLAEIVRQELGVDLTARYAGVIIPHPFGKASGQLSTTVGQVEADIEAGIAFVVLKTLIAEDKSGAKSMGDWTIRETKMQVERRNSATGRDGWTVTWKGRGWHGTFPEYLDFFERSLMRARGAAVPIVPSVKYHLPVGDEPFRQDEYSHTTRALFDVWSHYGGAGPMLLEKDFSPTLAGDDRARQRETILRWLAEVPAEIERAAPGKTRLGVKLMNALFDDAFQVEMTRTAVRGSPSFLIGFNRLFDPDRKVAYGGFDLSDRNLRVLDALRSDVSLPLSGTGNICSGRMMVEYALRGAENGQVHTFFQIPLSSYTATDGNRTARALHTLILHPEEGLVPWLWHLEEAGSLASKDGLVHFLDLVAKPGPS